MFPQLVLLGDFNMKVGVLFSGGKDSVYSAYLSKLNGDDIRCLISLDSKNKYSYMFHTPSIANVSILAEAMEIPILIKKTEGIKEKELEDLENIILDAKNKYKIEGIVSGAIMSVYQSSRIKKICDKLNLKLINPLWQKEQLKLLDELIKNNFHVLIIGVFAYPLNKTYLGRKIDSKLIQELKELNEKYKISLIGEGGEFESLVLSCPLYKKHISIVGFEDFCDGENSFYRELKLKIKNE